MRDLAAGEDRDDVIERPADDDASDPGHKVLDQLPRRRGARLGASGAGNIKERLPVGVSDDIAPGHRVGVPGSGEAAWGFCHGPLNRAAVKGLRFQPENASTGRYFNAELLQALHRMSCPAPGLNATTTKPLDNPSTRRRNSSEASSETAPDPVRPQWGQRSATVQALNAFMNA